MIGSPQTPVPTDAILCVILDGEAVLYDTDAAMVHHLNPAATAIWQRLDGRTFDELVAELITITGVPRNQTFSEVSQAVEEFRAAGLVSG